MRAYHLYFAIAAVILAVVAVDEHYDLLRRVEVAEAERDKAFDDAVLMTLALGDCEDHLRVAGEVCVEVCQTCWCAMDCSREGCVGE